LRRTEGVLNESPMYNASAMDVHAQVADFIHRNNLLEKSQKVIVGVSGGADSLCLLDCLHRLRFDLVLAHLDHQIRPESGAEADYCRQIAKRFGIPAAMGSADVPSYAGGGRSLEEASRLLRYRHLAQVAKSYETNLIATGHTADDQVETILMHFLRGAGASGLRGMLPKTSMDEWVGVPEGKGKWLVRPLLEITREQTVAHCRGQGLEPIHDPSNEDLSYFRNRLRHNLLPELETYNPSIRKTLLRTGHVMAAIADLQRAIVDEVWPQLVTEAGEHALLLQVEALLSRPIAVQRAVLRRGVLSLMQDIRELGFEQVDRGLAFAATGRKGSRYTIVGDLELLHMGQDALLWKRGSDVSFPQFPQVAKARRRKIKIPGEVKLANGWLLKAGAAEMVGEGIESIMQQANEQRVFLDADKIDGALQLRSWEQGDRIQVLGMKGRAKVSDIFINEKVPQPVRRKWPVVVDDGQIVWVAGIRMAHGVRLTQHSRRTIELRLEEPESGA
jgi:tRNA(Ile)-lysidine synthase